MEISCCVLQNDQMRQDLTEYKLQLQSQRNMMVARAEDTDIQNKLMKKNKDLAEAMEELQVYSKTNIKQPLSKRQKLFFKTNYSLMQVKSITECSKGSILQYFWPSLSYHLSLRPLFCLFLSGRFTQVLLYI